MTKIIYIFSGLGADERAFQQMDLSGLSKTFIKWVLPFDKETIENYATRLLEQIKTTRPILIGLSFGGMMAIEVAKQIETEKIILISSAKTKNEIPPYFRWAGKVGFNKLMPAKFLTRSNFITEWLFGATTAIDKQLLKAILSDTDPVFLKWAIERIAKWKNETLFENLKHIHGTADKILPFRFVTCDYEIKKGGHFMTVNKATEVAKLVRAILGDESELDF